MTINILDQDIIVTIIDDDRIQVNLLTNNPNQQAAIEFQDEGNTLGTIGTVSKINFVGSSIVASRSGSTITVTVSGGSGGSGDVTGPSSSVDGDLALFNGTTGKIIKATGLTLSNDDILQRKAGAWVNRTLAQLRADLGLITVVPIYHSVANVTLTNQANSDLEFSVSPGYRTKFDGTNYIQIRLVVNVAISSASANNPRMYIKYSTDNSTFTLIGAGTVASGEAATFASTGVMVTSWITLPAGAKTDVFYAVFVNGGDGAADPALRDISLQLR